MKSINIEQCPLAEKEDYRKEVFALLPNLQDIDSINRKGEDVGEQESEDDEDEDDEDDGGFIEEDEPKHSHDGNKPQNEDEKEEEESSYSEEEIVPGKRLLDLPESEEEFGHLAGHGPNPGVNFPDEKEESSEGTLIVQ